MTEWTESDEGAYMRFAQDIRDLRDVLARARVMRVEWSTRDIHDSLDRALDRLAER